MPQFPHEEVAFESGINVRFAIYNSNNDYIPEHWHRSMEVIYIYEGSMELIEGQRVLLLHAGDYHVVNSAAVHDTVPGSVITDSLCVSHRCHPRI